MINDETKQLFNNFVNNNSHKEVISLLNSELEKCELSEEEKGWAYWNISDRFAMLRDGEGEICNHKLFQKHVQNMKPEYLYWIVSDHTQYATLEYTNNGEYWRECYLYACEKSCVNSTNRRICFESHRAAVDIPLTRECPYSIEVSLKALDNMKNMLSYLKDDYNFEFYMITYFTQYINFFTLIKSSIDKSIIQQSIKTFEALIELLKVDKDEIRDNTVYLLGSWQQLNGQRSKYAQASAGIYNYIVALINAQKFIIATEFYNKAIKLGFKTSSTYFLNKIKYAEENL